MMFHASIVTESHGRYMKMTKMLKLKSFIQKFCQAILIYSIWASFILPRKHLTLSKECRNEILAPDTADTLPKFHFGTPLSVNRKMKDASICNFF